MKETYTKRGVSVRIERSGRLTSTVVTREHGVAMRERGQFHAESRGERTLASAPDVGGATDVARSLAALAGGRVAIERLTVASGVAEHTLVDGETNTTWSEEIARAHVSLVNREASLRVGVDIGAVRAAELPLHVAIETASALRLVAAGHLPSVGSVELSPAVAAALWRFLAGHPALVEGSRLRLTQSAHPTWSLDGIGKEIQQREISAGSPSSLFRPSYRIAPVPAWFHVSAALKGPRRSRSRRKPPMRAIALVRPFRLTRTSVSARVLVAMETASLVVELDIPREELASTVVRMSGDAIWFPFEGGAFGRDTLLEGVRITSAP